MYATLRYCWEELDELAQLVDAEIGQGFVARTPRWAMLNSLRTSLREAQYQLRPGGDTSPVVELTAELVGLRVWKAEAIEVITRWEESYDLLDGVGEGGPLGQQKSVIVRDFVEDALAAGDYLVIAFEQEAAVFCPQCSDAIAGRTQFTISELREFAAAHRRSHR